MRPPHGAGPAGKDERVPITLLDAILIVIMLISAVLAMIRGFSREVLSIVSWVAAAFAALTFYEALAPFVSSLKPDTLQPDSLTTQGLSAAIIFFVVLILVSYLTMKVADFIIDSRIGALDRTLGFIFGAARGALLVIIALNFFLWIVGNQVPDWIANAKSRPLMEEIGNDIREALPDDLGALVTRKDEPDAAPE